jgi:hypothetical protein
MFRLQQTNKVCLKHGEAHVCEAYTGDDGSQQHAYGQSRKRLVHEINYRALNYRALLNCRALVAANPALIFRTLSRIVPYILTYYILEYINPLLLA